MYAGDGLRAFLLTMATVFWSTENILTDLIDPNIRIFYKKEKEANVAITEGFLSSAQLVSICG